MRFGVTESGERREYAGMHYFEAALHYKMNQRTNALDSTPAGTAPGSAGMPLLQPNGFCPSDRLVHSFYGGTVMKEGTVWSTGYDAVYEAAGYGNTSVRERVTTEV